MIATNATRQNTIPITDAIIFIIVRTLIFGDPTSGWPSMVCIIIFIAGIQLLCMGILGQYMAKTYLETKKRPLYLVEETEEDEIC